MEFSNVDCIKLLLDVSDFVDWRACSWQLSGSFYWTLVGLLPSMGMIYRGLPLFYYLFAVIS